MRALPRCDALLYLIVMAEFEVILAFWFGDPPANAEDVAARVRRWFGGGPEFDDELAARFAAEMAAAADGRLDEWGATARGRLALILLLDQCPRNTYRAQAEAFAQDETALAWAVDGIGRGMDLELAPLERTFFYMPMQHAESLEIQEQSVATFEALASGDVAPHMRKYLLDSAQYARAHRDIIARFGRFPHRNAVLGRDSTEEEAAYLEKGASTFGQ